MFYEHSNGSSTLPRGFRFHHEEGDRPKTPEPMDADEPQQPSPPRPARLKVRRRVASSFQAPTQQFLASVATADVPIPTIEEPHTASDQTKDFEMLDREPLSIETAGYLAPSSGLRQGSPPKTPMPMLSLESGNAQRPDWAAGSCSPPSPDCFQRPMSALSNSSGFSDDSFYSGSRVSHRSEDGSCTSPESDISDPFQFPSMSKAKGKGRATKFNEPDQGLLLNPKLRSKTRKDAHWTRPQSAHLWAVYLLYLQDATVTPFRIGASCVPPQGIIDRVSREAKRSWKGGPKPSTSTVRRSTRLRSVTPRDPFEKSGSITPTAEGPKIYAQWPHSSNATRAHLRELCKSKDSNPVQRHHHLQSRSPTPFSKPYRSNFEKSEPPRLAAFQTHDIALSLATSTSETMQPDGPLAQLAVSDESETPTTSSFPPLETYKPLSFGASRGFIFEENARGRRLGSPFSRTYGPSSSTNLLAPSRSPPRTHSHSTTSPRLGSPVRFDEARSLNGTMKRRAQHSLDEELSPNGAVLRPSILDEQLFGNSASLLSVPNSNSQRRVRSRGFSLGDEALRSPAFHLPLISDLALPTKSNAPTLLPSVEFPPPRLGSPFSLSTSTSNATSASVSEIAKSQTFPRRLFQPHPSTATVRRSAFATMHQTRRSIESFDFGSSGSGSGNGYGVGVGFGLQERLGRLDGRLREIREREREGGEKR